jgi:hypothetical protein
VETLRLTERCVSEVRVGRAKIPCEFVEGVVPNEYTRRHVEHAVLGIELLDCRTTTRCVAFTEYLLEVPIKQFMDTVIHNHPLRLVSAGANHPAPDDVSGPAAIEAYATTAESDHVQQTASHRDVLKEMDELILVPEMVVKEHGGRKREQEENTRDDSSAIAK